MRPSLLSWGLRRHIRYKRKGRTAFQTHKRGSDPELHKERCESRGPRVREVRPRTPFSMPAGPLEKGHLLPPIHFPNKKSPCMGHCQCQRWLRKNHLAQADPKRRQLLRPTILIVSSTGCWKSRCWVEWDGFMLPCIMYEDSVDHSLCLARCSQQRRKRGNPEI